MTSNDNTVARTLHDLGLATWFGGSLMGATGVNGAAASAVKTALTVAALEKPPPTPPSPAAAASDPSAV